MHNLMLVNAVAPDLAIARLHELFEEVVGAIDSGGQSAMRAALKRASAELAKIPHKMPMSQVPTILLVGEIYVRSEGLARRWLPEYLAQHGVAAYTAPAHEWVHYTNYQFEHQLNDLPTTKAKRFKNRIKWAIMTKAEKDVKQLLSGSGWFVHRAVDVNHLIKAGEQFISRNLAGEAILTIGGPMAEVGTHFCGAISIGPFGCMPNRLAESILNLNFDREHLLRFRKDKETDRVTAQMNSM